MRRVAHFLIRLYPASWRTRYGEEIEALIDDSLPGWPAVFDLLKEAIRMRLSIPSFPKLALMLSIAGLLIGLLVSYSVRRTYVSRAELSIEDSAPGSLRLGDYLMQTEQEVLSRTSLSRMIQDPGLDLYPEERARMPLEDVIEKMLTQAIRISVDMPQSTGPDRLAFRIAFAYRDRVKVRDTVQALLTRFVEANLARQSALPEAGNPFTSAHVNLTVLDPQGMPVLLPNRSVCMFYGLVAGIVAASFVAIFRRGPPPIPFPAQTA